MLVDEFRAFFELRGNSLFIRDLFLVLQRMLETCSEIHCNGPELHLSPDHCLILYQSNIILPDEAFPKAVDIINEGTDPPDSGGVIHTNAPFLFSL